MMTLRNLPRIEAARAAVKAYSEFEHDYDVGMEVIVDLLADLRVLLQSEGVNPDHFFMAADSYQENQRRRPRHGWKNYETWALVAWLARKEPTRYWYEQAGKHAAAAADRPQVINQTWTEAEAARNYLAEQLEEEIKASVPSEPDSLYAEWLASSLLSVDWGQIAESLLETIASQGDESA